MSLVNLAEDIMGMATKFLDNSKLRMINFVKKSCNSK